MTAWICIRRNLDSLDVNQMEVSILIVLSHCPVGLQFENQAVLQSGRREGMRSSLLEEQFLRKHTQGPTGPGTAAPRKSLNPRPRRQPFMCLHALHVKNHITRIQVLLRLPSGSDTVNMNLPFNVLLEAFLVHFVRDRQ